MCLLNNSIVAAFFGAFFAFILVFVADFIRERRKKKFVYELIRKNLKLTKAKKDAIRRIIKGMKKDEVIKGGRLLNYNIQEMESLKLQSVNKFKIDELLALDAIFFKMDSINNMVPVVSN